MFKKKTDLSERSKSLVKNKDARNLRSDIESLLKGQKERVDELFPPGKGNVSVARLASKTLLYSVEDVAIAFDVNARNNLVPTLSALWKVPQGLRTIVVHSPVSSFVLNGADLMLPGVATLQGLQGLTKGEVVAIRVAGNPLPFAVGESEVAWALLQECAELGMRPKGRGVKVLHVFGDELWRASGAVVPNAGFDDSHVRAIEEEVVGGWSALTGNRVSTQGGDTEQEDNNPDCDDDQEGEGEGEGEREGEGEDASGNDHDDDDCGDEEEDRSRVDTTLLVHLLRVVKYVVRDKALPLLVSTFWVYITRSLKAEAETETMNIKASSYKKAGAFLAYAQKLGIVQITDANGVASVIAVHREHEMFRLHNERIKVGANSEALKAYCEGSADEYVRIGDTSGSGRGSTTVASIGVKKGDTKMKVIQLYKFPKNVLEVFGVVRGEFGEHLTSAEVRALLIAYVEKRGMVQEADRGKVDLFRSDTLSRFIGPKALLKRKEKEQQQQRAKPASEETKVKSYQREKDEGRSDIPVNLNEMVLTSEFGEEEEEHEEEGEEGSDLGGNWPRAGTSQRGVGMVGGVWMGVTGMSKQHKAVGNESNNKSKGKDKTCARETSDGGRPPLDSGVWKWKPVSLPPPCPKSTQQQKAKGKAVSFTPSAGSGMPGASAVEPEYDTLSREELLKVFTAKLSPYSAIVRPGRPPVIMSGGLPMIKIDVLSRMGNKVVSVLHGLEAYGYDGKDVAREFQKKFACSASVSPVTGQPQLREVVVQGNWATELETHLGEACGVPKHLLEIKYGKNVKAKRKGR